jgi:uncharacterized protein with GYD domain
MATFIMLTRLSHQNLDSPKSLEALNQQVAEHVRKECPDVEWQQSYAVLGSADYVDIFTAPDNETATKVATIIRTYGQATTEIWPATEWKRFKKLAEELSPALAAG